jgi:signal transduction histidine kinase
VIERIADGAFRILKVGDALRDQLAEFGRVRKEMDAMLDDRIQARTRTELKTSHENVHANLRRLLWMSLLLIGIAAIVVSGAAIAIYRQSVRLSDISVDELRAAFSRLSASERLRGALLRRVVSAQEVERGRIARDLHDQMSQNLSALSLGSASIQRTSNRTSDNLHSVESLQVIAQRLADDLHFVAWNLRPAVLDDLGLHGAVSSLVET